MSSERVNDAVLNTVFHRGSYTVEPFNETSRLIWDQRQHAVFGISPGNSYFQIARLTDLLAWLRTEFHQVDVVVPDSALEHTYQALGYDQQRAAKKARSESNVVYNRVARAWKSSGGPRTVDGLHRMSDLASDDVYRDTLATCERVLNERGALWSTCAEMSREVLGARGHDESFTSEQIERAMRYLTAELPFFLASSDIFNVPSSLNFYHRKLPLAELVFSDKSPLQAPRRQAYATIRPVR